MLRAVCFDLDGTLFDDRQYVRAGLEAAAEELAAREGVDLRAELLAAYFRRGITERTFDVVLSEAGLSTDHVPALVDAYHGIDASLVPYPDAEATLTKLCGEYRLGLVTGGRNGRTKLRRLGLARYFGAVVVTPERGEEKTESAPFVDALAALGVSPSDAAYVGDRPTLDVRRPADLGMATIRVRRGRFGDEESEGGLEPDATVDSLEGVPAALERVDG